MALIISEWVLDFFLSCNVSLEESFSLNDMFQFTRVLWFVVFVVIKDDECFQRLFKERRGERANGYQKQGTMWFERLIVQCDIYFFWMLTDCLDSNFRNRQKFHSWIHQMSSVMLRDSYLGNRVLCGNDCNMKVFIVDMIKCFSFQREFLLRGITSLKKQNYIRLVRRKRKPISSIVATCFRSTC